jgi:hypothetical protein
MTKADYGKALELGGRQRKLLVVFNRQNWNANSGIDLEPRSRTRRSAVGSCVYTRKSDLSSVIRGGFSHRWDESRILLVIEKPFPLADQ